MDFRLKRRFAIGANHIYQLWLSSEGHSAMTGGEALITDKEDDEFSAWDGYISGKNLELEPYNRIVQSWRTTEFNEDEEDSMIEILLTEINGQTELTLIHTKLPPHGEQYKQGWIDHYFDPMELYFSSNQRVF